MITEPTTLATDYVLVWDGGFSPDGRPQLVTGLRGILYVQLDASGPAVAITPSDASSTHGRIDP